MDIGLYEDWMKPQVSKLFSAQYGVTEEEFLNLIDKFYESSFQKNKCIRIIAKDQNKVIGFQSFFYWPYTFNGQVFNSYQSGNSLVHPDYRGKGIFQKLLNYLDEQKEQLKIDFLIGFPIDASIGSLLRNKWINLFNLKWYVKTNSFLSLFLSFNINKLIAYFPYTSHFPISEAHDRIKLLATPAFNDWRYAIYDNTKYFSFTYKQEKKELVLKLKINIRKSVIKELIIGDIITSSYEVDFLNDAFSKFVKTAKKIKSITLISIAYNEACDYNLMTVLKKHHFKKINKQIYFCIKPISSNNTIINPQTWEVYRGDIDTW